MVAGSEAHAVRHENGASATAYPPWIERACVIVPALDAESSLGAVVRSLQDEIPALKEAIFVVDDGSRDATASVAKSLGCVVIAHGDNRGKGAALKTGLATALARGFTVALVVDADGQHPAIEARQVLLANDGEDALVLGVRDLARDGAPRANQFSNGISNYFLSKFAGRRLADTQCGLRRYPIRRTLELAARGEGYDFEAEVLLRAVWAGVEIVELPIRVLYTHDRRSHFRVSRDPWRIIRTVVRTLPSKSAMTRSGQGG
jgi:glycosyltransferase involved in cell wall biosynthesis